jgi:hypothetical protein
MPRRLSKLLVAVLAVALLAGAARRRAIAPSPVLSLDARRSFAVTDQAILDGFSFARVMNAIVERSGTRTTALRLYQQMLDTQNPKPGLVVANAPHCDDFVVDGKPAFNQLPRRCPTPEGAFATTDPFATGDQIPLALLNRFDLAPVDGSNCGQYRIIFARKTNATFDRLHLIFEAVLPNPKPSEGIAACRAVAQFWADLSKVNSIFERRARLEQFFFTGIPGFEPVFDPDHYSSASGGGIRTMHNTGGPLRNRFYQFRLAVRGNDLFAEPDVLQNMPYGKFFDASYDNPAAQRFRDAFIDNIRNLAISDVNLYFMNIPQEFLLAESNPSDGEPDTIFAIPFLGSLITPEGRQFSSRISAELKKVGSPLSTLDIINRAQIQSCVGCHFFDGNVGTTEFYQQVSESIVEDGEAGPRFAISRTMKSVFVPHRMDVLRSFLVSGEAPVHSNGTVGGGRTVQ